MFCTKCGNQLNSSARFCSACGAPVAKSPSEETPDEIPSAEEAVLGTTISDASETVVGENKTEINSPEAPAVEEGADETNPPEAPAIAAVEEGADEANPPEAPAVAAVEEGADETNPPAAPAIAAVEEGADEANPPETPAIAAVEEGADETNPPAAPAIAAVEEGADETNPPEAPAIAAAAEIPSGAAGSAATEPLPAPSFDEFAKENPAPKKKKKRLAPFIAGGIAVAVAGTAAVGWFGFRNRVLRLFLGDAGFAVRIEKKTGEFLSLGDHAGAALSETLAAQIDEVLLLERKRNEADGSELGDYENEELLALVARLRALTERFGGSEIAYGLSIEPDVLLDALLSQSNEIGDLFELIGKFRSTLCVETSDEADRLTMSAEYDGEEIVGGTFTLDPNTLVVTAPALSGYTFFTEYTEPTDETAASSVSAEELNRLGETISALYYEAYAEAAFTYEDGSFPVAGRTVEGTRIRAELSAEQLNALFQKIADTIQNDEYLRSYYAEAIGGDPSEFDALFDEPITFNAPFIAESYLSANETLLAKTYSFGIAEDEEEQGEDGEKNPFTFAYARPDENDSLRIALPDGKCLGFDRVTNAETAEDDGTLEFSYTGSTEKNAPTLVLALDYVNNGTTELFGEPITLGTYTLHLSEKDTMLRSLLLGSSVEEKTDDDLMALEEAQPEGSLAILNTILGQFTLTVSIQPLEGAENTIRTDLTLSLGDYLKVSAYLEQKPLEAAGEPIVMPPTDGEKCLNLKEGADETTSAAVRIDFYENLLRLIDENESFAELAERLQLRENIEKSLTEERETIEFLAHYADYSNPSRYRADSVAQSIKRKFDSEYWGLLLAMNEDGSENEKWGTEEVTRTIRLYFDKNGEMTVLDDGGMSYLDFDAADFKDDYEDYKNLYCEILFSAYGEQPNGVTVVYTDDPSDLPEGLPTAYNYIDRLYEWNGRENAVGPFIVGASPSLSEGVSTAEERLRKEREEQARMREALDELNDSAKRLNSAVNGFLRANPSLFREDVLIASFILKYDKNEGWTVDSLTGNENESVSASTIFTEGVSAVGRLTEHLNRRFPEFTPVKAQVHLAWEYNTNLGESDAVTAIGTGVIPADAPALFQDGDLPWALAFWLGYESNWNANNPSADPEAGFYWLNWDTCIPFGSYCAETNAPLAIDSYGIGEEIPEYEIETLDEYARRLADAAAPYAEEHDLMKNGQTLYSLVLAYNNGEWRFENAYTNNYLLSGGEGPDREEIEGLMDLLNARSSEGRLGIAREITAELHFSDHGKLVGVGTAFVTSALDFTDVHVPGTADFENGYYYDWNARNRDAENRPGVYYTDYATAIPFGSYCTSSNAPLGLYEPIF